MFAPARTFPGNASHGTTFEPAPAPVAPQAQPCPPELVEADDFSRIGLIGYGAFGRLIARHAPADVSLLAWDVAPVAGTDGRTRMVALEEVAACPVVVLAAPVTETAGLCRQIASMLRPGALVVDVGSVKVQPVADMQAHLPAHVEIAGLHPLFGPQSAAGGLAGQRLVVCPVRGRKALRLAAMLRAWCGLQIQIATPEVHDREMAMVQGVTHMVARLVTALDEQPTRMVTRSYALLMEAVNMVRHDNPAVFDAIALRNPFVADVQAQFFAAAGALRQDLDARRNALSEKVGARSP